MLPNVPQFAVAYYGVLRPGGVVVPMNPLLKGREVSFYLSDPDAKVVFAWHEFADAAKQGAQETATEAIIVEPGVVEELLGSVGPQPKVVDREPSDTAVILYTSGTTGTPKGAELTHSNLLDNAAVITNIASISADDMLLGALPLFHAFGQTCALNGAMANGATLSMIPRFDLARRSKSSNATGWRSSRVFRRCSRGCFTTPTGSATTFRACACASPGAPRCRSK